MAADSLPQVVLSEKDVARFWSKVEKRGPDECWEWKGKPDNDGYGRFSVNGKKRGAHQVALELSLRRALEPGKWACHHCDNPGCVNSRHLYEGTSETNIADCVKRGRTARGDRNASRLYPEKRLRGDQHPMRRDPSLRRYGDENPSRKYPERQVRGERVSLAKLGDEQVLAIRREFATGRVSRVELADAYGVSWSAIEGIVSGRTWAHLPMEGLTPRRKGEGLRNTKISASDATAIRRRYAAGGVRQVDLAADFGVSQAVISAIIRGKIWCQVTE